jgi:hypothetical protein
VFWATREYPASRRTNRTAVPLAVTFKSHEPLPNGWNRTELTGIGGVRTWCGLGVFAHNLVKISTLTALKPISGASNGVPKPATRNTTALTSGFWRLRHFWVTKTGR